ncbi:hypothetical protein C8F01DRAFT_1332979 [Mycena amicta]|nr:hypothetical protein C8F01DRAFT_1332979 [Mycena amicta]
MDNLLSAAHAARRRTHIPRYREDLEESSSRAPIEIPQPIDDDHATLYSFTLVYHHPVGIPYPAVLAVILDLPPSMPVHPQRSVVINESASLFPDSFSVPVVVVPPPPAPASHSHAYTGGLAYSPPVTKGRLRGENDPRNRSFGGSYGSSSDRSPCSLLELNARLVAEAVPMHFPEFPPPNEPTDTQGYAPKSSPVRQLTSSIPFRSLVSRIRRFAVTLRTHPHLLDSVPTQLALGLPLLQPALPLGARL